MLNTQSADEVWVVPCGPRPDKKSLSTPALERYIHTRTPTSHHYANRRMCVPTRTRYCMCVLAVESMFDATMPVKVSAIEVFEDMALASADLMATLSST